MKQLIYLKSTIIHLKSPFLLAACLILAVVFKLDSIAMLLIILGLSVGLAMETGQRRPGPPCPGRA